MTGKKFEELVEILRRLRVDCPWDREQTNDSIKAATLEEAHEVVEAIDEKDYNELKGELGDLLLHIVFHSVIAEEDKHFRLDEVIDGINQKLIRRHPHVFGDVNAETAKEIERNWEKIKLQEGRKSALEGVPKNISTLYRAFRLQQKASKVGFDWDNRDDVWAKVTEELEEFREAEREGDPEKMEKEMGDILFSLVNYSRFTKINPDNALRSTIEKFIKRFQYIEKEVKEQGKEMEDVSLEEMDKIWEESKKKSP